MITFETQEEFEDAVMSVLSDRLEVILKCGGLPVNAKISVSLVDKSDDSLISSDY